MTIELTEPLEHVVPAPIAARLRASIAVATVADLLRTTSDTLHDAGLTFAQRELLRRIVQRYRRQLPPDVRHAEWHQRMKAARR